MKVRSGPRHQTDGTADPLTPEADGNGNEKKAGENPAYVLHHHLTAKRYGFLARVRVSAIAAALIAGRRTKPSPLYTLRLIS